MDRQVIRAQIIQLTIALTGMALVLWLQTPQWQRQMMMRAVRRRLHGAAARVARSSGHRAMGAELAGRLNDAVHGYEVTERLSRLRDRL